MLSQNTPEYVIVYLGAAAAGVTLTTINPGYTVCKSSVLHNKSLLKVSQELVGMVYIESTGCSSNQMTKRYQEMIIVRPVVHASFLSRTSLYGS